MKKLFLVLVFFSVNFISFAAQPLRKPFFQILVDGKDLKSGDVLLVTNGQKLKIEVKMEGGRRDFCKFPEIYADVTSSSQILSRGDDGITYERNGVTASWKLVAESAEFTSDQNISVKQLDEKGTAEIVVSANPFEQSFLRIVNTARWQFNQNETTLNEENKADEIIYIRIKGKSDTWFHSENIQVSGIKNELVQERLKAVQAACDSIRMSFYRINLTEIQQNIKNLRTEHTNLKAAIDEIKAGNTSYKLSVKFLGLPSDKPIADLESLLQLKTIWEEHEDQFTELEMELSELSHENNPTTAQKLIQLIEKYAAIQITLSEKNRSIVNLYFPEINLDELKLPENLDKIAKEKKLNDFPSTLDSFIQFIDRRSERVAIESHQISTAQSRAQAFRLLDGMLRSYFSSITWAQWQSSRDL